MLPCKHVRFTTILNMCSNTWEANPLKDEDVAGTQITANANVNKLRFSR